MNKNMIGAIIAVVAILGIAGVVVANKPDTGGRTESQSSTPADQPNDGGMHGGGQSTMQTDSSGKQDFTGKSEVSIDITDFAFANKDITVSKGTKVTWTNRDSAKHNVFSENEGGPQGELLAKDQSFSFTFDKTGKFDYICEPHPYMKAVVNVI